MKAVNGGNPNGGYGPRWISLTVAAWIPVEQAEAAIHAIQAALRDHAHPVLGPREGVIAYEVDDDERRSQEHAWAVQLSRVAELANIERQDARDPISLHPNPNREIEP